MDAIPGLRDLSPNWLGRLAALWPERTALVTPDDGWRYTYGDLEARAETLARGLCELGIGKGDRVAAVMHNDVEMVDLLFACGRLGAILVPLNWRLAQREIGQLIADTDPSIVVAAEEFADLTRQAAPSVRLISEETLPQLMRAEAELPVIDVRLDDPWLILYTGGTTGIPKGAILTHGSILWNAINTVISWGMSETDVGPNFTPMFHTGGWNVFTLPIFLVGGRVILPRRFDPAQVLRIVEEERPTLLFLVPTMFQVVAEQPGFEQADFSCLKWAISGGAPLPEAIYRLWKDKVRIFKQGYGLTEAGPNNFATSDVDALVKHGTTVGKPTFFVEMRVVDDEGQDVPDGETGELLIAGPHMFAGYWRRPDATTEAIHDGWLHTGDVARRDAEGFYHIVDRKKDMIISGGENIFPTEVESVLYEHPAVRECAVVGVADETWGEAVTAVVACKAGRTCTQKELREHMRSNLARYKVPKAFVFVDELPKNAAGKILRTEARNIAVSAIQ